MMHSCSKLKATLLVCVLAVPGAAVAGQGDTVVLRSVEVTTVGERFMLATRDGASYELAALQSPTDCPAATGGGLWACGEGALQALSAAVAGETLACEIVRDGDPPAVRCTAQTRDLGLWMLRIGWAKLPLEWQGQIAEYDEAELAARTAGAMLWYDAGSEHAAATLDHLVPVGRHPEDLGFSTFLVRSFEGDVRVYDRVSAPEDTISVDYFAADLSTRAGRLAFEPRNEWVPALDVGDFIMHPTTSRGLAYARVPPSVDRFPLAYVVDAADSEGQRYDTVVLDGMAWVARRGDLQPFRVPLGNRGERRGATAAERRTIGSGLPEDELRAGVWALDGLRVVVAEDAYGCVRATWCRFAVLDETDVVVSGIAREAPELLVQDDDAVLRTVAAEASLTVLVWQEPGGEWKRWAP